MQNIDLTKKKQSIIKYKKLLSHIKLGKEILTYGDIENEKINSTTIRVLLLKKI